jgi:hypothetical protein
VRAGYGQRDLPGMLGLPRDRLHQQCICSTPILPGRKG